jgi:hypothetical protein
MGMELHPVEIHARRNRRVLATKFIGLRLLLPVTILSLPLCTRRTSAHLDEPAYGADNLQSRHKAGHGIGTPWLFATGWSTLRLDRHNGIVENPA